MKKTIGKFLTIALALCLILSTVPIVSVSAGNAYFITFSYNNEYLGWARTSYNTTIADGGSIVKIFVFPNEGCLIDSFTVTRTDTDEVVSSRNTGTYEDGYIYEFSMPYCNVNVHSSFKVDNASGYHTVTLSCSEGGSAELKRNGMGRYKEMFTAKSGDAILLSKVEPDEGYSNNGYGYYYTPQGGKINITTDRPFSMPDYDVTVYVDFDKLYDIRFVTSGGSGTAIDFAKSIYGWITELTSQVCGEIVAVVTTPDSSYNNAGRIRVVSDSGATLLNSGFEGTDTSQRRFEMPEEPVTVYLTFYKDSYDINCTAEHGTLGYSAPDGTAAGKTVTLTPSPDEGYGLKELYYTYTPEVGLDEVKEYIDISGDLSFTVPNADVEVHAVYGMIRRAQWLDGDGSLLDSATYIEGSALPSTDKTPTKAGGLDYKYEFSGWKDPVYYVPDLTVFRPDFDTLYCVTVAGGTADRSYVKAGDTVTLTPDPASDGMYFSGWVVESGSADVADNKFTMTQGSVVLRAKYEMQKSVTVGIDFSDTKGYVGKAFTVSGSVTENDSVLDVGGTVTVTFSSGANDAEGAVSYTVPVVNGEYTCDVPALTAGNNRVWAEYSGDGEYGHALTMDYLNLYGVSASELSVNLGEGNVKKTYNVCDELDVTDLYIWYYWMDGTDEHYPVTADMVSGFDNTKSGVQKLTVASPYPSDDELSYNITMKKIYTTDDSVDVNLDSWFSRDEQDKAPFEIGFSFRKLQLLGVQKRDNNRDIRFVAVLDSKVAQDADEYGFLAAKGDTVDEAAGKLSGVTYASAQNIYNCKGSSNTVSGTYGKYSSNTDYKYVTLAVDNIGDSAVAVKFYVKKGGKVYYADYTNKDGITKEACAVNWAALS